MNERVKPRPLTVDDLQDLYNELRGSRSAPAILDARALFMERQMAEAQAKLREAYESYRESRFRILRQDPEKQVDSKAKDRDRQLRRLTRKQEKAREIIGLFEDYLRQLDKLVEKERQRQTAEAARTTSPESSERSAGEPAAAEADEVSAAGASSPSGGEPAAGSALRPEAVKPEVLQTLHELIGDRQLEFIGSRFDFKPLQHVEDIRPDAVYLFRKKDRCLLIHAVADPQDPDRLHCVDLQHPENRVQLSRQRMVDLSVQRQLVLLLDKRPSRSQRD